MIYMLDLLIINSPILFIYLNCKQELLRIKHIKQNILLQSGIYLLVLIFHQGNSLQQKQFYSQKAKKQGQEMIEMFKSVKCVKLNQVTMTCLSQACHLSPFICSNQCICYSVHKNFCRIRNINDINSDLLKVLKFQFLVMFSPNLKGNSIEVMGRFAQQKEPKIKNQQFALIYDPIFQDGSSHQILFRLKSIKGCIGVGLFSLKIMIKNNFKYIPDKDYLNHGAYMISSNNYKFSSKIPEQNVKECQNISLNQNNIIKVIYNSSEHILTFMTQNGKSQTLKISNDEQTLHFGVYLYQKGDLVQIINNKI